MDVSRVWHQRLQFLPLYPQVGLRDWLHEPELDEISALWDIADRDVVASDGLQILIRPLSGSHGEVVIGVEVWDAEPDALVTGGSQGWDGYRTLSLECPSGQVYVDNPTGLATDLEGALTAGRGTYGVRVAWRASDDVSDPLETGAAGRSDDNGIADRYLIQLWRTGDLSLPTQARFQDDDDDG